MTCPTCSQPSHRQVEAFIRDHGTEAWFQAILLGAVSTRMLVHRLHRQGVLVIDDTGSLNINEEGTA